MGRLHCLISLVPQTKESRPLRRRRSNSFRRTTNLEKNLTSLNTYKAHLLPVPPEPPKNVIYISFGIFILKEYGVCHGSLDTGQMTFPGCAQAFSGERGDHAAAATAHLYSNFPPDWVGGAPEAPPTRRARLRARGGHGHLDPKQSAGLPEFSAAAWFPPAQQIRLSCLPASLRG